MDKKLIERIALEVACDIYGVSGKVDFEEMFPDKQEQKFLHAFISRIDDERGKGAVAWNYELEQPAFDRLFASGVKSDSPLFLSPTIPEGMVLVPVEPTEEMMRELTDPFIAINGDNRTAFNTAYRAMLAAAQGECNAD